MVDNLFLGGSYEKEKEVKSWEKEIGAWLRK